MAGLLYTLFLCSLVLSLPGTATAQDPGPGQFLIASRQMQGPVFRETVILLLDYSEMGAVGLIVNKPSLTTALAALEAEGLSAAYRGPLYLGGPVARDTLRVLMRTNTPPAAAMPILADVCVVPLGDDRLQELEGDQTMLRFYVGYAGWGPGQLDEELARGSWHLHRASADLVFAPDSDETWHRLIPPRQFQVSR